MKVKARYNEFFFICLRSLESLHMQICSTFKAIYLNRLWCSNRNNVLNSKVNSHLTYLLRRPICPTHARLNFLSLKSFQTAPKCAEWRHLQRRGGGMCGGCNPAFTRASVPALHFEVKNVSVPASSSPLNSLWQNSSPRAVTAVGPEVVFPREPSKHSSLLRLHNGHNNFQQQRGAQLTRGRGQAAAFSPTGRPRISGRLLSALPFFPTSPLFSRCLAFEKRYTLLKRDAVVYLAVLPVHRAGPSFPCTLL